MVDKEHKLVELRASNRTSERKACESILEVGSEKEVGWVQRDPTMASSGWR